MQRLSQTGFMSAAQTDTQRERLLALQAQQQALGRSEAALKRERDALTAQINEAKLQAQVESSDLDKTRAMLTQELSENQARTRLVITAPQAGIVTGLSAQVGQTVGTGMLLATLLPVQQPVVPAKAPQSVRAEPVEALVARHQPREATNHHGTSAPGATTLEAHFFATTRQAGFVEPGQAVRIRYAA